MNDDMYEVAFSGEIVAGADLEQVKQAVASLFKADEKKLAQLFSGKRIVIKKNITLDMAQKYQAALQKAQAVCELKNLSAEALVEAIEISAPESSASETSAEKPQQPVKTFDHNIAPAPDTDPLHIKADNIADLNASVAELGSDLQDEIKEVEFVEPDLSDLSVAPVGSDIGDEQPKPKAPDLDISHLSLK